MWPSRLIAAAGWWLRGQGLSLGFVPEDVGFMPEAPPSKGDVSKPVPHPRLPEIGPQDTAQYTGTQQTKKDSEAHLTWCSTQGLYPEDKGDGSGRDEEADCRVQQLLRIHSDKKALLGQRTQGRRVDTAGPLDCPTLGPGEVPLREVLSVRDR